MATLDVRRVRPDSEPPVEGVLEPSPSTGEHVKELEQLLVELEKQAAFYKRRGDEYFRVVRDFELERDTWKKMYMNDGRAHQQAQAMLERALEQCRYAVRRCLTVLNEYRQKAGEQPVKDVVEISAPPVGLAAATAKRLDAEQAAMPAQLVGQVELGKADAVLGPPPEGPVGTPEKGS